MNQLILPFFIYTAADYGKIAPPNSYIDALKMNPKQLALHLQMLDADNGLYNRHFWWKGSFEVVINTK